MAETKSSDTGGIKPMLIEGRMARQRERTIGMTDAERAWRAQWLKDQHLSPNEPRHVPEWEKFRLNPIRRMYRYPLDAVANALEPTFGPKVRFARYMTGKILIGLYIAVGVVYYSKYGKHDWTRTGGWRLKATRRPVLPGEPGYPHIETRKPSDYYTRDFENVPLHFSGKL